ncbi:MAG: S-ribosylhomocysteine lyase [Acutalibacteraceae bacterium]|jgi:S-ribosylhomocysteine lyase
MEKIASFRVDHLKLEPGIYLSRLDRHEGVAVTTFDLRFTAPNREPVVDMPALHTIEHLGATFLRNSEQKDNILYFGPMGCRTGFYLLVLGEQKPQEIALLIIKMCDFIIGFEGEIPGARPEECGNWREQNLEMAKYYVSKYKKAILENKNFEYK